MKDIKNMFTLYCIECEEPLRDVPLYNGGDEAYPPSFLFCLNPKCKRHGLLTVTYKTLVEKDVKGKHKGV
jgi:hypothetical protein